MHLNGIIITKQFISHWNFKRLNGSVGRSHIHVHVGYMFLKGNEEVVIRNLKSKTFFLLYIYIYIYTMHNKFSNCFVWVSPSTSDLEFHLLS